MPRSRIKITTMPEIKKLKRGGYAARFRIPPHDGKPESKSGWRKFPDAETKGEANSKAEKYREELEEDINNYATKTDISLGIYARRWHDERKETGEIQPTTWTRDDQKIRSIEECAIAKIPIAELTPEDIDQFKIEMKKKGWSTYKQRRTLEKLAQVLKFAESRRVIPHDPSRSVKRIKNRATERKAIPKSVLIPMIFALDHERPKDGKKAAVRIAIGTGFRLGECLGLEWGDCHLLEEHAYISLRRQLNRDGELVAPKNDETGDIPIDDDTAQWLWEWKLVYKQQTGKSDKEIETMPVCCNNRHGHLSHTNYSKWWKKFCVDHGWGTFTEEYKTIDANGHGQIHRLGYTGPKFHEIRHTFGTSVMSSGADLRTLQALMRHKTLRSSEPYLHSITENMVEAAAKVGADRQYVEFLRPEPISKRPIRPEAKETTPLRKPKRKRRRKPNDSQGRTKP